MQSESSSVVHNRYSNDKSMDCLHEVPVCSLLVDVKLSCKKLQYHHDHNTWSFISLTARHLSLSSKQPRSSWSSQRAGMTEVGSPSAQDAAATEQYALPGCQFSRRHTRTLASCDHCAEGGVGEGCLSGLGRFTIATVLIGWTNGRSRRPDKVDKVICGKISMTLTDCYIQLAAGRCKTLEAAGLAPADNKIRALIGAAAKRNIRRAESGSLSPAQQ